MRNIVLALIVVAVMVTGGLAGTFAGFVDTEISPNNFVQAGIMDLLVNGKNDPNVPPKISIQWIQPSKSYDFFVDVEYWGHSTHNGDLWMKYKNVESIEAGNKTGLVYWGAPIFDYLPGSPVGPNVASSEPELIAEEGNGMVDQIYIPPFGPCTLGVDYASGVATHLDVLTWAYDPDHNGILDDPVDPATGDVDLTPGNWFEIASLSGKLATLTTKDFVGKLQPQVPSKIWIRVHLQQIACPDWPDPQTKWWPTNALQGDIATWDMEFELQADP